MTYRDRWILTAVEDLQVYSITDALYYVVICRDEAARVWQQRESEWERERLAREQLMQEVSLLLPWSLLL